MTDLYQIVHPNWDRVKLLYCKMLDFDVEPTKRIISSGWEFSNFIQCTKVFYVIGISGGN